MMISSTVAFCLLMLIYPSVKALQSDIKDPTIFYLFEGQSVQPWQASLQFGQVPITNKEASTLRNSLSLKQTDSLNLKWKPKDIKNEWGAIDENILTFNLINKLQHVDISSVTNKAALLVEFKVIRAPNELVDITLECEWNWKCRTSYALKNILRKVPKKEWLSIPIPLQCFSDPNFDFSKLSGLMITTKGKMELELKSISLSALPSNFEAC